MLPGFIMPNKKRATTPGVAAGQQVAGAAGVTPGPIGPTGGGSALSTSTAVPKLPGSTSPIVSRSDAPGVTAGKGVQQSSGTPPQPQHDPAMDPVTPAPSIDSLSEQLAQKEIGGALNGVDTSEQEKLIRELMQQQVGAGMVSNRAQAGRGGWNGGALAMMQGDTLRGAGTQAAQAILGERTRANQQAIDNAHAAEGIDISERNAANQKTELDARLAALQHLLDPTGAGGGGDGAAAGDGGGGGGNNGGIDDGTSPLGKGTDQSQTATAAASSKPKEVTKDQVPTDAQEAQDVEKQYPGYLVYRRAKADGSGYDYWMVKHDAATVAG